MLRKTTSGFTREQDMKILYALVTSIVLIATASLTSSAQPLRFPQLYERAELDTHTGWIPQDVETLVSSPDVIFKGRFGKLLSHEPWWGYEETRESMQKRLGDDAHLVDTLGLPSSLYEIVVDEILAGDIEGASIVYRMLESTPGDRRYTNESDEKLFFLTRNPDGTYGRLGLPFILTRRDGSYVFEYPSDTAPGRMNTGTLEFAPSMVAEEFEAFIRDAIHRVRPR